MGDQNHPMAVTPLKGRALGSLSLVAVLLLLCLQLAAAASGSAQDKKKMEPCLSGDPDRPTSSPGERGREGRSRQKTGASPAQDKSKAGRPHDKDPRACSNETSTGEAKGPSFPWSPSNPLGYQKISDLGGKERVPTVGQSKDENSVL